MSESNVVSIAAVRASMAGVPSSTSLAVAEETVVVTDIVPARGQWNKTQPDRKTSMTEEQRQLRNAQLLRELFPSFRERIAAIIADLEDQGLRPRIQDAWRSRDEQLELFKQGFSKVKYGFHNVTGKKGEKEALAVDLLDDDAPLNPSPRYLLMLATAARTRGCQTGILWGVPDNMQSAVITAIDMADFDAPVKIGWDPTHVEPLGITISEAKGGKRPS